jgi:hypothetical protein
MRLSPNETLLTMISHTLRRWMMLMTTIMMIDNRTMFFIVLVCGMVGAAAQPHPEFIPRDTASHCESFRLAPRTKIHDVVAAGASCSNCSVVQLACLYMVRRVLRCALL